MMLWIADPDCAVAGYDPLGFIPSFLSGEDPRPAVEQIADNYCGGWDSFKGPTFDADFRLCYPGDPPMTPRAWTTLRDETIRVYDYGFTAIFQQDGSFDVARLG